MGSVASPTALLVKFLSVPPPSPLSPRLVVGLFGGFLPPPAPASDLGSDFLRG